MPFLWPELRSIWLSLHQMLHRKLVTARSYACLESVSFLHGHGRGTLASLPREAMKIVKFLFKDKENFSCVFCEKAPFYYSFLKTKSRICNTLYTIVTFSFRRLVVWVCGKGTCVLISDPYAEVTTYGNYDRLLNCIAVSYRTF